MAGPQARLAQLTPQFPFPDGGYESIYLRAVDPERKRGIWLRHTILQERGAEPVASVWSVVYGDGAPRAHKVSGPPVRDWMGVEDISRIGPGGVTGEIAQLTWAAEDAEPLRHLPRALMYRAPLPRTKPETPLPALRLSGKVGDLELDGWPGMLGHNWGAEHAERWIWLHGIFDGGAWLDVVIGRVRVAGVLLPWIANGAVSVEGRRHRVGGRARVEEDPLGARVRVGPLSVDVRSAADDVVVWQYGHHHHTANGSVATLTATLGGRRLHTPHGGVYELGMREQDHGLAVLPFSDP